MKMTILLLCQFTFFFCLEGYTQSGQLTLSSGALQIDWAKQTDGWHIGNIMTGGKRLAHPSGYYTIIFNSVKPHGGRIEPNVEGKGMSFFPERAVQNADGSITFSHDLRVVSVEATWKMDPRYSNDIVVQLKVKSKVTGFYSVSTPTIAVVDPEDLAWGMVPGNWYGKEVEKDLELSTKYSQGLPATPMITKEKTTMTLCPLLSTKGGVTFAVIPEPGTGADPWAKDTSSRENNNVAMSTMNRHNQLTPVAYSPVLGGTGSYLKEGETTVFNFRYSVQAADWFTVFNHAVNDIYRFPAMLAIQKQKISLSERLRLLQLHLKDDISSKWNTRKVDGLEIGANGSKNADIGAMLMMAYSNHDTVMQRRLKYVRNYKLTQQQTDTGFFQYAATGEYISKDGYVSEIGNWIEPMYTTFYTLMDMGNMLLFNPGDEELKKRLRLAADKMISWQHADGSWDVAYDQFSHQLTFPGLTDLRSTWYGLLIAYRILGDKKYLQSAEKGAGWLITNGVDKGYYLGVCGDARNIWDFATAQTSQALLDLYTQTNNERYKKAAIEAARVYTTSIFTHPIATNETKIVGGVKRKDWEITQAGLGVEHIRGTAAGAGPILISGFTGLFVRMYGLTGDSIFLNMARAAARGRHAFMEDSSGQTIYYWMDADKVAKRVLATPHHAYWQIGWITDYLLSEVALRSGGKVSFPYGFMTPKVGPHVSYGYSSGSVFNNKADLLTPPGLLTSENPYFEHVSALSADKKKLYVIVMNQSVEQQSGTIKLDLSRIAADKNYRWTGEKPLLGMVKGRDRRAGTLDLQIPAWGIQVISLDVKTL